MLIMQIATGATLLVLCLLVYVSLSEGDTGK
jgi:hypothetical protein